MQKPTDVRPDAGAVRKPPKDSVMYGKKHIWEHLTATTWDDGSFRETSALSFFVEDGLVKCALNDKDLKRSLYMTGTTLEAVLEALEGQLEAGGGDWRLWHANKRKK